MAFVQERIQDAASRNSELLAGLHETESAPSQLYQQINYIKELDQQIQTSRKKVGWLKQQTASELKDHKKYSESTFRRFAHKASGRKERFDEKAAKEEREYFDAIQAQKTAEDDLAYAQQLKAEADKAKAEYEQSALRHDTLQQELDALYNSIFAGPTPGFPEEDAREQGVETAAQQCSTISQKFEKEKQVGYLFRQTMNRLYEARQFLDAAHSASQFDMFGGGTLISMQKRNYLERAESSISQVRMLQNQIRQIEPAAAEIGPMNIASGSIWGDVIFDNIFSDMEMHDRIKDSEVQVGNALRKLANQIKRSEGREKSEAEELRRKSETLRLARVELQRAREQAFERVARGETIDVDAEAEAPSEAPPAYTA